MPNRTLALEIGATSLRAVLVERTLRTQRVLGFYTAPRTGAALAADLKGLIERHRLEWDEAVSALPGDAVTHRILTLPFHDRRRLDQTIPFELETHLPFELEDSIIDYQLLATRGESAIVLAALVPKATVREHLDALAAAGIDPRVVDLAPLAALNVLRRSRAELASRVGVVLLADGDGTVAFFDDGRLAGLRALGRVAGDDASALVRNASWSLRALAGDDDLSVLTLWIGGSAQPAAALLARTIGATPRGLDTLDVPAVPVALRAEQAAYAAPLGLALREGGGSEAFGLDFRRGEFAYHREREALWRGVTRAGILAAVMIALMIASFVLDMRRLQARRDAVRAEIRALFSSALPAARTIVNERAQLEAEIATLNKERRLYGGLAPSAPRAVDVLRAITAAVPEDVRLDVEELAIDADAVRLRGATPSYDGVEAVKRGLAARPEFRDVEAKDVRTSVDGQRVEFRVTLTIAPSA